MTDKYILDGKTPVPCEDLITWGKWFKQNSKQRRVARDEFREIVVSTVFLGLDYSFTGGKPILFETMVFGGKYNDEQERYHTYEEAEKGHKKWVRKVKKIL